LHISAVALPCGAPNRLLVSFLSTESQLGARLRYTPHAFPTLGTIALKKGIALLVIAAAVLAGLLVTPTGAAPNPLTCEGYPQARVFVDSQSWWRATPGMSGTDFGHVHAGACIPERETLSANTQLDVRIMLHDNPGQLEMFEVVYHGADYETDVEFPQTPPFTCPNPGTCERWLQVPIDLSLFNHSGLQELRFRAFVDTPNSNVMIASLDWQVYIENGATRMNQTRLAFPRGKGWYSGSGYCEAGYMSAPLPKVPLSGVWSPRLRMVNHGALDDLPVTGYSVRLDPDFHAEPMNEGTVLRDGPGEFPEQDVPIDTTLLPDGPHRLFLRADCDDPRGSTNSGVLVVSFTTANGSTPTASDTPTSTPSPTLGADSDADGVPDVTDNCPSWPNPTQDLPHWLVPLNDPDCDGFSWAVETSAGTNPVLHCGLDAWPADINNDSFADITDVSAVTGSFGVSVPPAPVRQNVAPDPVDAFVDITDISRLTGLFGQACAP